MGNICKGSNRAGPKYRLIVPNHTLEEHVKSPHHPNRNHRSNRIKTTKYSIITFLPKNLFEQFHRFANLYFLFVVALNWVPQVQAFGKEIAMIPIVFVLTVTAVKDAFEDFRRYKSDKKVNSSQCRVFCNTADKHDFHPKDWCDIHVGDIIHLSCNDIIPADIVLLKSSDEQGICHVETMNLDGETNLKQRQAVTGIDYENNDYKAWRFKYTVECEQPNAEIYKFNGYVKLSDREGDIAPLNQNNILLRGCIMRNTDYIEGLVVYAGHETKSMMNNRNPRYKRSKLERALNRDVIWCVIILLFLCFFCAAGSALWLGQYEDSTAIPFIPFESSEQFNPYFQAFIVFFTYIIIFQSVIPLPLYVSLEIIKILQIYFINQDLHLYYEPTDKRVECRALNITEDLGQVEYIFSDKTGTLTENQMEFKSCTIGGKNYPHVAEFDDDIQSETGSRYSLANVSRNSSIMENLKLETEIQRELSSMCLRSVGSIDVSLSVASHKNQVQEFFLLMAICNTVVVSLHPHEDIMDNEGNIASSTNNLQVPSIAPKVNLNQNQSENQVPTEKYTKIPDNPPGKKLPPLNSDGSTPRNGKSNLLPPIQQNNLDRDKFPRYTQRLEYMPKISTPTGSVAGSIAGSSIRSDMSRTRYEAESPDELALVRAASTYNCCLKGRTANTVTVWLPGEGEVELKVLHVLSFDSTRKRMSVIVKHPLTKETILYTKGADSAVLSVLAKKYKEDEEFIKMRRNTEEHILAYAMQGLRTLCMAKKTISKADYEKWAKRHLEAESALDDREEKLLASACSIESELELLGATGIEDKLQEGVPETIHNLRMAGIKVWVLTGDKQETAIQIAYSSQLFNQDQQLIVVNADNKEATCDLMKHHLEEIMLEEKTPRETESSPPTKKKEYGLVIDGKTLAFALEKDMEKLFLVLAGKCNSVICCRSSPIQKGMVVHLAREELKVLTLAIGDGANDVAMIQMADVGIGISGQEGMQAVMASDFAIARFQFLERMLLVHGHWCYSRVARFSVFMFYKSLISTMVLFWFNLYSGYSGSTHIDSLFLMGHHVFFTAFPPIVNGIMDKDLVPETLLAFPTLYKVGPEGRTYTRLSFLIVFLDSIYQSVCVHFICYFGYFDGVGIWEFGTTMMVSLVLSILFHQAIETYRWMWPQWLTLILSFVVFWLFGIVIDSFFMTFDHPMTPYWVMQNTISKPIHACIVLVSVVAALLPRIIVRSVQMTVFPDEIMQAQYYEKLKEEEQEETAPNSRVASPDSGYENRKDSKDSGYDNKALDMKNDTQEENSLPEVAYRNGRVRHRQNSNQRTAEPQIAESAT
ncbi:phospholipid-transporting ATPase VA-like isoform X2 [Mercenaria mercenaria]|uniref:phospholipid-transporting ATPase VA-like isoform X2 n=1 Tax=Mercenaria mercenaria TaxID=6596 RepID=UPI00234FA904|nr:phospholipid-transporting ATPase VA-like isoform X2 [Mercenaria mercenaria]